MKKKARPAALVLSGEGLTAADLSQFARDPARKISLSDKSRPRIRKGRATVEEILKNNRRAYGINTGFGRLAEVSIEKQQIEELQKNLLVSHAVGVGELFSPVEVRAIWLLRIQGVLQGHSGVREELVDFLAKAINAGLLPSVPEQGSCGASGDLAPLAHLCLPLLGKGKTRIWKGKTISDEMGGAQALKKLNLKPVRLAAKEGLALINGTQVMTALGALTCARLQNLVRCADILGALSLEASLGSQAPFHAAIHALRPHPGQKAVAANLLRLLKGSRIMEAHKDCNKVQDAYSFRCMPQVHGAMRDTLAHAQSVIEREMNSVTDNPLIFPDHADDLQVISGGNFHGQPVAQVLDFMGIAATDFASIAERRIERLLNPDLSELPAFLAYQGGLHSGLMMVQVTAAALVSESKTLAHPASADSIPTSANKEDHVSMGTTAARKLRRIVDNLEHVLAIEWLCAAKALEYRRPLKSGKGVEAAYACLRTRVKTLDEDREMQGDMAGAKDMIADGSLLEAVQRAVGDLA